MIIMVNGEKQTLEESVISIAELLILHKVAKPDMVSVQLNGRFVDKKEYGAKKISDNDEIDFLYFIGGGKAP